MHIIFKPQKGSGQATLCIDRENQHVEVMTDLPPHEVGPWLEPLLLSMGIKSIPYTVVPNDRVQEWMGAGWEVVAATVMVKRKI